MISKITENLYIGEYIDIINNNIKDTIKNLKVLEETGITHILSLCSEGIEDRQIQKEQELFWHSNLPVYIRLHRQPVPANLEFTKICGSRDPIKLGLELAFYNLIGILLDEPNAKVLVHCIAGIDRSPFVVASYLAQTNNGWHSRYNGERKMENYYSFQVTNLAEAYAEIKKVRPFIQEHYEWKWWKD